MLKRILLYAMWVSLIVAIMLAVLEGRWFAAFVSLAALLLSFIPITIQRWYKVHIPQGFIVAIVFFIYATLFLGEVVDFYHRFWWWDAALHTGSAIGLGLIGFVILILLYRDERVTARPGVLAVFAFSFAMMIGGVWEIFEFTVDHVFGTSMQKNGLVDTMWDLIVDAVGALVASVSGYLYLKRGEGWILSRLIHEGVTKNRNK